MYTFHDRLENLKKEIITEIETIFKSFNSDMVEFNNQFELATFSGIWAYSLVSSSASSSASIMVTNNKGRAILLDNLLFEDLVEIHDRLSDGWVCVPKPVHVREIIDLLNHNDTSTDNVIHILKETNLYENVRQHIIDEYKNETY